MGAVFEREPSRLVNQTEGGRLVERHGVGHGKAGFGPHFELFGKGAIFGLGGHPIADFEAGDTGTHRADNAGGAFTGRKRQGRFDLVFAFDHQNVGIIGFGRMDIDHHFARSGLRRGNLHDRNCIEGRKSRNPNRFHER